MMIMKVYYNTPRSQFGDKDDKDNKDKDKNNNKTTTLIQNHHMSLITNKV